MFVSLDYLWLAWVALRDDLVFTGAVLLKIIGGFWMVFAFLLVWGIVTKFMGGRGDE